MPTSSQQPELENGTWPPTFAAYTNYDTNTLILGLENELKNTKAPDTYHKFMQHLLEELKEKQSDQTTIQKLTDKANLYSTYVKNTEQTYNTLAEMYKDERKRGDTLEEKVLELNEKISKMESERINLVAETKNALLCMTNTLKQTKEEHAKASNKQALGRKNIEDNLIAREFELGEVRAKLRDSEAQIVKFKDENTQLRSLVVHLRNNSMIPLQSPQQHIQTQNHHYQ